jgi:hypothetical protein
MSGIVILLRRLSMKLLCSCWLIVLMASWAGAEMVNLAPLAHVDGSAMTDGAKGPDNIND